MLKLRIARRGEAPPGANYRFVLSFASEEQRQAWAATPLHQQVWLPIVNTLKNGNSPALLYDSGLAKDARRARDHPTDGRRRLKLPLVARVAAVGKLV
jgi:hypothetical protein